MPGVLKNALDWASRAPQSVFHAKPVAIVGASPGGFGTVRGQMALRQMLMFPEARVLPGPALLVSRAGDLFSADGDLVDAATRKRLSGVLTAFAGWIRQLT
jgi:chromate reductase, NAD(P)H dehydrogenase (quinone)